MTEKKKRLIPSCRLTGLRIQTRTTRKKGRLVADIYWRGERIAKIFIKKNEAVASFYAAKARDVKPIPLERLRSVIGFADGLLHGFPNRRN